MRLTIAALALSVACAHVSPRPLPVVFVHGNGANRMQWRAQVEHLGATRQAVAIDLPGMGEAKPPANGDYSVHAMAEHVAAEVDAMGLKRFVLVGHSYGGYVVADYAANHPDRVAALVFVDSSGKITVSDERAAKFEEAVRADPKQVIPSWFARLLAPSSQAVRDSVLATALGTNIDAFVGALAGMRRSDFAGNVAKYHGPTLAIGATKLESESSFIRQFPSIPARHVDNAGHWLMLDQPEELNRILDEFLATVR